MTREELYILERELARDLGGLRLSRLDVEVHTSRRLSMQPPRLVLNGSRPIEVSVGGDWLLRELRRS